MIFILNVVIARVCAHLFSFWFHLYGYKHTNTFRLRRQTKIYKQQVMNDDLLASQVLESAKRLVRRFLAEVVEPIQSNPEQEPRIPVAWAACVFVCVFLVVGLCLSPLLSCATKFLCRSIKTLFEFICASIFVLGLAIVIDVVLYKSSTLFSWLA